MAVISVNWVVSLGLASGRTGLFEWGGSPLTNKFTLVVPICQVIVEQYEPEEKKALVWQFMALFRQYAQQQQQAEAAADTFSLAPPPATSIPPGTTPAPSKMHVERVLSRLITPMLSASLERGQSGCLDAPLVEAIVSDLLQVGGVWI